MKELSEKLGLSPWEYDRVEKAVCKTRIRRLGRELRVLFRDQFDGGAWLSREDESFDCVSPIEMIEGGKIDRVWRILYQLRTGAPS